MFNQAIRIMTLCNNSRTALTEETLALVGLATNNRLPLPGPCGMSQMLQKSVVMYRRYNVYMRETEHVMLHVILTSLCQENGRSFPDHLPNGVSSHLRKWAEEWGRIILTTHSPLHSTL